MTTTGVTATAAGFDRKLTLPLILGALLNPVNSSMLAVALIPIGAALGAPPSQTVWLVSALYLATSAVLLLAVTLADRSLRGLGRG